MFSLEPGRTIRIKEKNREEKETPNDFKTYKVFYKDLYIMFYKKKLCNTKKIIKTRKYASLEIVNVITGGRKIFTGGINQELIN